MKLFFLIFALSSTTTLEKCKSNSPFTIYEATYGVENNSITDGIGQLLLSNLKYNIKSDGKILELVAQFPQIKEQENLHIRVNGETSLRYNIKDNLVYLPLESSIYRNELVEFTRLNRKVVVLGYPCFVLTNNHRDTLFITQEIPFYVNPLMLNDETINGGVVKAVLTSTATTYSLLNINKSKVEKGLDSLFYTNQIIKTKPNIFFDIN